MFGKFNEFRQNPFLFLNKSKFKVPNNMSDPNEIIDYLLRTDQLKQDQYNQVQMRFKQFESLGQLPKQL